MNWKDSLDRYLTTPPDDGFNVWCELVTEKFSDKFWEENEEWSLDDNGQCSIWMNELFNREKKSAEAAVIIERAFKLYIDGRGESKIS